MRKKIIFSLIGILILVIIAGGFFWWREKREIKGRPEDYVIKETAEGKFVENKKAGLRVKVPEGWHIEEVRDGEGLMIFYSPNITGEFRNNRIIPPLDKGCIIHVSLVYEEKKIDQLKSGARYNLALLGVKSIKFEEITINNYQALKTTAITEKIGPGISIDIPYKGRTYSFLLIYASHEAEFCVQEFDKLLKVISIK